MRTTLNLDDDLMRSAKRYAADHGRTISSLIEAALRELLGREKRQSKPFKLNWVIVPGGAQPGVDLTDRDALMERMDEPS